MGRPDRVSTPSVVHLSIAQQHIVLVASGSSGQCRHAEHAESCGDPREICSIFMKQDGAGGYSTTAGREQGGVVVEIIYS